MNVRYTILEVVKQNKPGSIPMPEVDMNLVIAYEDNLSQYKTVLESIGGKSIEANTDADVIAIIEKLSAGKKSVINTLTANPGDLIKLDAEALAAVDLAIIEGTIAVAENGAIWINEHHMKNRLLPFICQHLIFIINAKDIVPTMHHAYQYIDINETGFGVFIAGPSKTADIEQSLVIGAHGPVGLTVLIVTNK